MKPELILEALAKLDPANKDHWTADGLPRLGAVGEGVTRQQIVAAAPFFSRSNPKLEDAPADEELKQTLEDELKQMAAEREAAEKSLVEAAKQAAQAQKAIAEANAKLEKLRDDERKLDPRTPTEINMDYLKSEFNQRMLRAGAQKQASALLEQAGLGSEVKGLTLSPIDRAIAERVVRERKQRLREGK